MAAVGAWVYVFPKPDKGDGDAAKAERERVLATMDAVQKVVEKGAGLGWDGVCLAVGVRGRTAGLVGTSEAVVEERAGGWGFEEWEDAARDKGFEYVDAEAKGRNEFGEMQGMARVKEALEANEWEGEAALSDLEDLDGEGSGDEDWSKTFAAEEAEMGMELMGLKTELNSGDGEDQAAQVDELERMMSKLSGIRGELLSSSARKGLELICRVYRPGCWYAGGTEEEVCSESSKRPNEIALVLRLSLLTLICVILSTVLHILLSAQFVG